MQRSVRENIALPSHAAHPALGPDRPAATERQAVDARRRDAADRRPRRRRGPPAVGRQPAEGDDRPLGRRRRPDDALLRPDARHRHRHEAARSTCCCATSPEPGAAVLLYTSELKEIQLVCDRAIVIFGGRVVAEIDAADADEPTLLRAAYNLRSDARDARGDRRPRRSRTPRPRSATARPPAQRDRERGRRRPDARGRTVDAAIAGDAGCGRRNAWTLGLLGVPRRAPRVHQAHPAELRRDRHPGPRDLRPAARAGRRRRRRSSSSPAASTSRSAR